MLTRRDAIAGAAAALTLPALGLRAAEPRVLTARPGRALIGPEGARDTAIWGYDGLVPGPLLRATQGGRLVRRFQNELPQPSSVHWHGVRLENAMDGVAGLTQEPVAPGAQFHYDFALPDAGTYWYHPHNRTFEQMARGLYGALIVDEAEAAPQVDGDEVLLLDDWRITQDGEIAEGFGNMHDNAHAGRIGNWVTVNARPEWRIPASRYARLRLRLVNAANARVFTLAAKGLEGWVIALDGMPLAQPVPLSEIVLGPSQRADLIVDVTAEDEALIVTRERQGDFALVSFPVSGRARDVRLAAPSALPPNPVAPLGDLDTARRFDMAMEGGAMGRLSSARLGGRDTPMAELAEQGMVWALAGIAGMPEAPWIDATLGETLRIVIRNDTAWPHAMHLHGHHFRVLGTGGPGPLRDTVLIDRGEKAEIAFVADNPGEWLLHCHMLEHAASGMMTWLRIS